jgi:hypothetical protein
MARRRPRALGTIALTVAFGAAACGTATAESGVHGGETRDAAESPGLDGSVGDVGSTDASDRTANDGGPGASQSDEDSDGAAACPLTEVFLPPCNTIVPSGPLAATVCSLSEPPQPQGGAVADRTYVLESATLYGTCQAGGAAQATLVICRGLWDFGEVAIAPEAGGPLQVNYTSTEALRLRPRCPLLTCEEALLRLSSRAASRGAGRLPMNSRRAEWPSATWFRSTRRVFVGPESKRH